MTRLTLVFAAAFGALLLTGPAPADAGDHHRYSRDGQSLTPHRKSKHYRKKKQVRGYVRRRGGYSYSGTDVTNTYGDSRVRYGSNNAYRDPMQDRQTSTGIFDHGYFFNSGVGSIHGGDSPYMN